MKGGDRSTKNEGAMGGAGLLWSPAVSSKGVKPEEKGSRARGMAVGPPPPPGGWAALTLEGSASPRHDVLDKGWERRQKTATSPGPSQPLKPLLPGLYHLTANLPTTFSSL